MTRPAPTQPRGQLRIYLGAAVGVGKTYAMLDEGTRRRARGADVLVAALRTHGREQTRRQAAELPHLAEGPGLIEQLLARHPDVVLLDELAEHPAEGIERLLAAGIDVITTVNIQQLASLTTTVEHITGTPASATVPDDLVRRADQIELVDMSAEALRRRLMHGNIYPPHQITAAISHYFQPESLTALRELALLWLAERVDEARQSYGHADTPGGPRRPALSRERIVVAVTAGPAGGQLLERGARIARRSTSAELLAIHVAGTEDDRDGPIGLDQQRRLVESLGGTFHSVVGPDVAAAVLAFARSVQATQLVVGVAGGQPRGRLARGRQRWRLVLAGRRGPGIAQTIADGAGEIDVHVLAPQAEPARSRQLPARVSGLTLRRRLIGAVVAVALPSAATLLLSRVNREPHFASDLSVYLVLVVITSLIGGFAPAVLAALLGSLLLNYFFTEPLHTLTIAQRDNVVALLMFLLVAVLVSSVVDLAARRSSQAIRARAEAETLSTLAGSLLRGEQALPALLERVREAFGMQSVQLLDTSSAVLASIGEQVAADAESTQAAIGDGRTLLLLGRRLSADDHRILGAFAAQVAVAYEQRELTAVAKQIEPLAEAERATTALLNAVSHDLRTPLAVAKAAISSLQAEDVQWSGEQHRELLQSAEAGLDRLTGLVTNLLDLSRLQAGVLPVFAVAVGVDDVLARALDSLGELDGRHELDGLGEGRRPDGPRGLVPAGTTADATDTRDATDTGDATEAVEATGRRLLVEVPDDLPLVLADAGLLERVLANLVQNALRYSPDSKPVLITGSAHAGRVEVRVIDRGVGISDADQAVVFEAFQRRTDTPSAGAGVGLGLALARGLTEAMGGMVTAEPTPGGGATLVVSLRTAGAHENPEWGATQ